MSSTKCVYFLNAEILKKKLRWMPWPLICCPSSLIFHIFDFSETAEENSTKLNSKQYLEVLYQACVFRAEGKTKMATLASNWLRQFRILRNH